MREVAAESTSGHGQPTLPGVPRNVDLGSAARGLMRDLYSETEKHPFRTVAIALGGGYVVGGGLFSPLTARLVGVLIRVGLRAAAMPLASLALGLADQAIPSRAKGPRT
jgi:hypothetical protein